MLDQIDPTVPRRVRAEWPGVMGPMESAMLRSAGMPQPVDRRDLLIEAGLDASAIEVYSHGETDLLVQTPDETPEPRNRRVEIAVR